MEKLTKLNIRPNDTYFMGYYIQDMKEPEIIKDADTGEVKGQIKLNRVLIQLVAPVDFDRWQAVGFGGSAVVEYGIPLDKACFVFGCDPKNFDVEETCKKLIGCPVRLDFTFNAKGKGVLRGITALAE